MLKLISSRWIWAWVLPLQITICEISYILDFPQLKTYVVFLQSGSILEPQQLSQGVSNHVKLQSEANKLQNFLWH